MLQLYLGSVILFVFTLQSSKLFRISKHPFMKDHDDLSIYNTFNYGFIHLYKKKDIEFLYT